MLLVGFVLQSNSYLTTRARNKTVHLWAAFETFIIQVSEARITQNSGTSGQTITTPVQKTGVPYLTGRSSFTFTRLLIMPLKIK